MPALLIAAALLAAGSAGPEPSRAEAPRADAPTVKLLLGAGEAEARIRLGEPDIARREAGGAVWTYARPSCALLVFFRPAGREGMRVVGANAGPRRRGEAAPAVDRCLAAVTAEKR